jgi:hypothetical protein
VTESAKVTLPETSIDGPGFSEGVDIAWTGTDAAHHLNLSSGTDGLHFPNKTILSETSPAGPAVVNFLTEQPPDIAWIGTDAAHHLNVEFGPNGTKLILPETSFARPAISFVAVSGAIKMLVAWTGTDANHSLNVLPITLPSLGGGPIVGKKTVLSQFSSDAGPSLVGSVTGASEFVLGWSVRGTERLNLAESSDGVHFSSALGNGLPETSAEAPQFLQDSSSSSSGCVVWTGTDAANHLNVQCTTQFPQFPNPAQTKTELSETALGAPGVSPFATSSPGEIAWTGTDAAHHLNVAQLQGL